jgi:hypothetical protein
MLILQCPPSRGFILQDEKIFGEQANARAKLYLFDLSENIGRRPINPSV